MNITYLKNVSKRRNSTRRPTGGTTRTARLKHDTSVENPVFMLDVVDPDINYIIAMGHYYYVTDIVVLNNDQAEYHCTNDVLATHRSEILGSSQYVLRCATEDYWNTKLIDDSYPIATDPDIFIQSKSTDFTTTDSAMIILSVKGQHGTTFWGVSRDMFSNDPHCLGDAIYNLSQDQDTLWSAIVSSDIDKNYLDPMSYITDAKIIPIPISSLAHATNQDTIYFGYWSFTDHDMSPVFHKITGNTVYESSEYTLDLQSKSTGQYEFLNCNRYRKYEVVLPGVGPIELDGDIVLTGNNIKVKFSIDVSGAICYQIAYGSGNVYKDYIMGDVSIPFAIHGQTADYSKTVGAGVGIVGGIAGGVGMGAVGGPVGMVAGGVMGAVSGVAHAISNAGPLFHTQSVGHNGSFARMEVNNDIYMKETIYKISNTDHDKLGAPCMRNVKLENLKGYVVCKNASLPLSGFDADRAEIESYLNTGVYIE